jgi:hypothetical protein
MIIFLPSCTYPLEATNGDISTRELDLISNLKYLRSKGFSYDQIVVVDNGFRRPSLPKGVNLIHDNSLFSCIPTIGEALMTKAVSEELGCYPSILKLHARCKLLNLNELLHYCQNKSEFVFLRRNHFRFSRSNFNKCPFAETRLYMLNPLSLNLLMDRILEILDDSIFFEQAFLSASYQVRQVRTSLITHGSFYPVFGGISGHNVNYNSASSRLTSYLHGLSYRLGL